MLFLGEDRAFASRTIFSLTRGRNKKGAKTEMRFAKVSRASWVAGFTNAASSDSSRFRVFLLAGGSCWHSPASKLRMPSAFPAGIFRTRALLANRNTFTDKLALESTTQFAGASGSAFFSAMLAAGLALEAGGGGTRFSPGAVTSGEGGKSGLTEFSGARVKAENCSFWVETTLVGVEGGENIGTENGADNV